MVSDTLVKFAFACYQQFSPVNILSLSWRFIRSQVRLSGQTGIWKHVDLGKIATDDTESLLNLPVRSSFFPTRATDFRHVSDLIRKLRPVACDKELIRLGPGSDGGYLVPNDLDGVVACFSPGVGTIAGFERDCAERGMDVFMADASVDGPSEPNPRFSFVKKFIGAISRNEVITLEDWVGGTVNATEGDLLLQMDIEGCEYETLLSTPASLLARFRILVVEFHHLDHLFSEPMFAIYSQVFEKILAGHTCVHIHPNNFRPSLKVNGLEVPQLAEFTFLRNDHIARAGFADRFPHPLDHDNTSNAPLPLARCWYGDL